MEGKKYYYKVEISTSRGMQIKEFLQKGIKAIREADRLAKNLGAVSRTDSPGCLIPGVGIGSLVFEKKPDRITYMSIGNNEYVPNPKTDEGRKLLRKISKLPMLTPFDALLAFGIPVNQNRTPAWFQEKNFFYLCCSYKLGPEYTEILSHEFEQKKKQLERKNSRK